MKRNITILGAGLVGSVLAVILKKQGYEVTIYERRADMRKDRVEAGRSINLAMSTRGWKALEIAGLRPEIEKIALPMPGRFLHQKDGSTAFQAYGKNGEAIYSVSRGELNKVLMNAAESEGVKIVFEHRSKHVDLKAQKITLQHGNEEKVVDFDLLFGADGAYSSLRTVLSHQDRTNYSQFFIEHGYKELSIPAGPNQSWSIEKNALHIWPRNNYMMIALPNIDGSFTCTLFFPFEGNPSFQSLQTDEEIKAFFAAQFPDAIALMPTLIEDFKNNPVSSLITTKIFPWKYEDKACLIGDAAHAIVPFYGQGMNAGFEDCTVLYDLLLEIGDDWQGILTKFEELRKPNADAVADLALLNFVEMRDKVADPVFLERKKIEKDLGIRFPEQFNSVYEMVSFSHTPYGEAWQCIQLQDKLLEKIMSRGEYFEQVKNPEFVSELSTWLSEYRQEFEKISLVHA